MPVNSTSDPFSDIIELANAQSVVAGGFRAGGSWAIRFPAPDKIKFFAIVKGGCWLSLDGEVAPIRLEAGDVFLHCKQIGFILAGDLAAVPLDATSLFSDTVRQVTLGNGEECVQIGGHVKLDPACGGLLADVLPTLIHVRSTAPQATVLKWLLEQLVLEGSAGLPGASVASSQIAQLLFVQLLRAHLADAESLPTGWLRALADRNIAPALRLMHSDPGRSWQLEELARSVAMSRTTFALRFKTVAGVPPLTYLLNWRMHIAKRTLREENTTLAALAASLGYTSESAFSHAFKRIVGVAPLRYRDTVRAGE